MGKYYMSLKKNIDVIQVSPKCHIFKNQPLIYLQMNLGRSNQDCWMVGNIRKFIQTKSHWNNSSGHIDQILNTKPYKTLPNLSLAAYLPRPDWPKSY